MTFFLVIDLFRVLYMVFFHRGAKSAADIDTGGPKSLLFNKITILPLIFLSWRVAKLHCQFRWGAWPDLPPGSATDLDSCLSTQSALELGPSHCPNGSLGQDLGLGGFAFALKMPELGNPNLVPNGSMNYVSQLGPVSITKISPNRACQMGPRQRPITLLSGDFVLDKHL